MANLDSYLKVKVELEQKQYPIYIGRHCLSDADLLRSYVMSTQVLVVTHHNVARHYLDQLKSVLVGKQCDVVILDDGERFKNQCSLQAIYDALIRGNHNRDTTVIALGGGVIGDIAGFAAATYQRGVRFLQLPTTLLAQVDAAIGGKTAINLPAGKNLIGTIYQPDAVIIDVDTLVTLPQREFCAGFAEIIKYGMLSGGSFFDQLVVILNNDLSCIAAETLALLIQQCCVIKASYVQTDEYEQGARALLNLGHTFAHALEVYSNYQRWLHGEAVAIGLYCASLLSNQLGYLSTAQLIAIDSLLQQMGLPRRIPRDINLQELQNLMFYDKKVKNKKLRLVLIKAIGDCYLDDSITEQCLYRVLTDAIEGDLQ
ncbi:MAG: 3-dehydroquinate synthase [Legionella sp.]